MYFSRCFPFFFVCFLCFTQTSSRSNVDSIETKRVNDELKHPANTPILQIALIAASTGRHLYRMPKSISEDCIRTAEVTFKLAAQPSLFDKSKSLIPDSIKAVQKSQAEKPESDYAIELLCEKLNEQFRKNVATFPDVEQLKKRVELPKPPKNYYVEIQPSETVFESMVNHMNDFVDPAFVKVISAEAFLDADTKIPRIGVELAATSKTIRELAKQKAFKSIVDDAFEQLLTDYVKELYSQKTDMKTKFDNDCYPYLKKMDAYFLQNTVLKEEYAKIKKDLVEKFSQSKEVSTS